MYIPQNINGIKLIWYIMKVVKMDKQGRIVIPAETRKKVRAKRFEITVKDNIIELRPAEDLDSLFGSLPDLDLDKIRKEHNAEVENEHFTHR